MTGVELRKQLFRVRTYICFALMAGIPTLMTLAFVLGGGPGGRRDLNLFTLATHSGLNMPLASLSLMCSFLLPVVVVIFAGSAVSEEGAWGSVRYLLLRPVSRGSLLASKLAVVALLALTAALLITFAGIVGGVLAFGWHEVITPSATILTPRVAFSRLMLATIYVAWSMSCVLAFAFLLSTMTDAAIGAVSGGIGLAIVSQILDAIPPLRSVRSILPTHYWHAWENLFATPAQTDDMVRGILIQLPYVAICLVLAWWWFHRKDITS